MTICFFGTYHREYSRNQILLKGLQKIGISVVEVHVPVTIMRLESKKHIGVLPIMHRLARKALLLPEIIKNFGRMKRCDVILCAYPAHVDLPIAWIVAKFLRIPLLFDPTFSLTDVFTNDFKILKPHSLFAKLLQFAEKIIFALPDVVLADTRYQQQKYHDLFGIPKERIRVVPLGADTSIYTSIGNSAGENTNEKKKFRVIYYGLYNPVHGVEYIIESAKILRIDPEIEFLLIGDGQTYKEMVKKTNDYGLSNIQFLKLMEKDALPYLSTADVFLGLFGRSESVFRTIANKVLQGLALGKAVVTGDGPGVASAFASGKHLMLIPPENAKTLADSIKKIKNSTELRKKLEYEGNREFQAHFTPASVAKQLVTVIRDIIQPPYTIK